MAPFLKPFGHPGSLLASLWMLFEILEAFRSAENLPRFRRELAEIPPRTCRDSAENLPRFRRELAEIPPRTCRDSAENFPRFRRESAKNQPRTRRVNPKQSCLSYCEFFEWTASSDKRFHKIAENKNGAAVSPLGGLQLNNY